jgi:transposase InsO family protein
MPWRDRQVKVLREEFIRSVLARQQSMSAICREYGISRKTGYKWLERFREEGQLEEHSREPQQQPTKTSAGVESLVLETRKRNPCWGARKIEAYLQRDGDAPPSYRTIHRIIKQHDLITPEASQKSRNLQRFERETSNELWQTDFKGEFLMGNATLCYPLTILDDHARFSLRIEPKPNQQNVTRSFVDTFREYGLPSAVLSDNGPYFAGIRGGYTQFERFLMDQDILPIHGRFYHPQTQGKIERFHRTLKQELLLAGTPHDLTEAGELFSRWRKFYNEVRPHAALNNRTPAQCYQPSSRQFMEQVPKFEYPTAFKLHKIDNWGYLRFNHQRSYLSETFIAAYVQLVPDEWKDIMHVHYRNFEIAQYDLITGARIMRRPKRINLSL